MVTGPAWPMYLRVMEHRWESIFIRETRMVIFLIAIVCGKADGASLISVPPKSFNASLGAEAIFTCVGAGNVEVVAWEVRGVNESAYIETFMRTSTTGILTITAVTEENDGAEVVCKPFTSEGQTDKSEPAILRVQGLLDAPRNLAITNMETDAITLTWEAPPTLDLTGIHPDISNYTVYIELNSSHFWWDNVTETEYTFTGTVQGEMLDPCSVYQFSVSARNVVGEGSRSERVEGSLHRSQPEIESATMSNVYFDQNASPNLSTKLKVRAGNFFSCTPVTIIASVTCERHQSCQKQFDRTNIVISDPECIPHNTFCIGTFTAMNDAGTSPPFAVPEFSTFDVQLVEVEMSDDTITITCHFAQGSAALGCHIQFLATEQDNEYEECTMRAIRDKGTSQNLSEAISGLPAGTYKLMVHDIEGNSLLSETHAYQHPSVITSNGAFPESSELDCKLTVITEEEDGGKDESNFITIAVVVAAIAVVAVLLIVTIVLVTALVWRSKAKRDNEETFEAEGNEYVKSPTGVSPLIAHLPDDQPETPATDDYATVQTAGSQPTVLHSPGAISGRTPPPAPPSQNQPETTATGDQHAPVSADQTAPPVGNRTKELNYIDVDPTKGARLHRIQQDTSVKYGTVQGGKQVTGDPISATSPFEYPVEESESQGEVQGTGDDWDAPPLPPRTQYSSSDEEDCFREVDDKLPLLVSGNSNNMGLKPLLHPFSSFGSS